MRSPNMNKKTQIKIALGFQK